MKKIKLVVVGYGNRGGVYADYSLDEPEEVEVVGIVDPNPFKLQVAKERYSLNDDQLFTSWEDFEAKKIEADVVVNSTMDETHYATAIQILKAKYNMLIEKPIVSKKEEILEIEELAKKNNCFVFVCHVLRYTPFYKTIKQLLVDDRIGEILTIEMNEHVCVQHYMTSYNRGKWSNESVCGSPFLLAKCCHDMDIACWMNNPATPVKVSSFALRNFYIPSKAPEGSTEYCYQCPFEKTCLYSATNMYIEHDPMPFLTWDKLNKPLNEITIEEKKEFLKTDKYGKCAFKTGGDLVDRQTVQVEFSSGALLTFNLVGTASEPNRYIHIVGSKGEIEGKIEQGKIIVRNYKDCYHKDETIDVSSQVINKAKFGGHMGGDYSLMHDLVRYINGDRSSISITSIKDSVNSHLIVFAAEESRKEEKIVRL